MEDLFKYAATTVYKSERKVNMGSIRKNTTAKGQMTTQYTNARFESINLRGQAFLTFAR